MNNDITLQDPADLLKFAKELAAIATEIKNIQQSTSGSVAFPPIQIGQPGTNAGTSPLAAGMPPLTEPAELAARFLDHQSLVDQNIQTLLNLLGLVSDAAANIANTYTTAAELEKFSQGLEHLSAAEVKAALSLP